MAAVTVLPALVAHPRCPRQHAAGDLCGIGGAEVAAVAHIAPDAERAIAQALCAHAHALAPGTVAAGALAGPEGAHVPVLAHLPGYSGGAPSDEPRYGAERIAPVQPLLDFLPFPERQLPVFFVHGSFLSAMDGKVWRLSTIAGKSRFVKCAVFSGRMALESGGACAPTHSRLNATVAPGLQVCG